MEQVRDIHKAIERYKKQKELLKKDTTILPENRKIILKFLEHAEDKLKRRKGRGRVEQIRYCKTLLKKIDLLKNTDRFFKKHFKDITKKDIERVYNALEDGKIKSLKGAAYKFSSRNDFYKKVFKSDFFEFIGKKDLAKEVITRESSDEGEVKFFEFEDLQKMASLCKSLQRELFLYLLFDTSMRIGTLLNMRCSDFEKRHNLDTKRDYYLFHIRKEYTKSKVDRTDALLIDRTNELLDIALQDKKPEELLFKWGYGNARKIIFDVTRRAKITTKPQGKPVSIHDFRKSGATYLLSRGFNIDYVKARLGHKPSSSVIDRYVNYLGLNANKTIKQSQDMDYNSLKAAYKEAIEQLKVLDANQKAMAERLEESVIKVVLAELKKSS